jgi:hypothetical protein
VKPFFQAGIVVQDIDRAMTELGAALGVTWGQPVVRTNGPYTIRAVFSTTGPPFVELIEGPAGSPWDAHGQSRLDHVGYWTDDIGAEIERLESLGLVVEADGRKIAGTPWAYLRAPESNLRVELLDSSMRDAFHQRWGLVDTGY